MDQGRSATQIRLNFFFIKYGEARSDTVGLMETLIRGKVRLDGSPLGNRWPGTGEGERAAELAFVSLGRDLFDESM